MRCPVGAGKTDVAPVTRSDAGGRALGGLLPGTTAGLAPARSGQEALVRAGGRADRVGANLGDIPQGDFCAPSGSLLPSLFRVGRSDEPLAGVQAGTRRQATTSVIV